MVADVSSPPLDAGSDFGAVGNHRRPLNFTTALPFELSAKIFLHCLPALPSLEIFEHCDLSKILPTLLALSSVCQAWRLIAWSTPELWTTLLIECKGFQLKPDLSFVKKSLHRSGNFPLAIRFGFDQSTRISDFGSTIHDVVKLICTHAHRWTVLQLSAPFSVISLMKASEDCHPVNLSCLIIHSFPDMEIGYSSTSTKPPIFSLGQSILPSPSRLSIHHIKCQNIHIDFSQLRHFYAGVITPLEFTNILRLVPRMASLSCTLSDYGIDNTQSLGPANTEMVYSQHMKSLKLGFNDTEVIVLDFLTFPSLEHFECCKLDFESLKRFFLRSGSRLTRLLLNQDVSNRKLVELLYLAPILRELTIEYCALQAEFFQHLWETATQKNDEAAFLSHLRVIHYTMVNMVHPGLFQWSNLSTWRIDPRGSAAWTRPLHRLTFKSTAQKDFEINFAAGDRAEILRLVESGLDVRILDRDGVDVLTSRIL
ncbi:hypothetical protein CPB83DRAFT_853850 [Crepidotus variabilis]|uniref:F-box domain-containing protein n=1 Tax=Crepidotus variabilis TaxID=179855 RepID=A0A9P6EGY4_9AGAR|nr:hypothetical protein CPB83DRAFT_853850 [Crepidotus variabilis]